MSDSYARSLEIMATTPTLLRAIVDGVPDAALRRRPTPEGWSAYDVLVHLFRAESTTIGPRIQRMLDEENPDLAPPATSAGLPASREPAAAPDDAAAILDAWQAARERNLQLFRSLAPSQLARTGRHPRYGQLTAREHVVEWAYHDLDHLRQILADLQAELYPAIGVFSALYPPPV